MSGAGGGAPAPRDAAEAGAEAWAEAGAVVWAVLPRDMHSYEASRVAASSFVMYQWLQAQAEPWLQRNRLQAHPRAQQMVESGAKPR